MACNRQRPIDGIRAAGEGGVTDVEDRDDRLQYHGTVPDIPIKSQEVCKTRPSEEVFLVS